MGRKFGELIAIGSAGMGFIPTILVGARTFILWRGKGYYARIARSEEELDRELILRERMGIKDIEIEVGGTKNVHVGGLKAKSLKEREDEMNGVNVSSTRKK